MQMTAGDGNWPCGPLVVEILPVAEQVASLTRAGQTALGQGQDQPSKNQAFAGVAPRTLGVYEPPEWSSRSAIARPRICTPEWW